MQFQGGKARQAKAIGELLRSLDAPNYLEPFVGGAWVLKEVAQHFETVVAGDFHLDLILMYQALQDGWVPPTEVSEAEWRHQRTAEPSPLRAFIGYGTSFGGRWFEGYARTGHTDASMSHRSLMRKAEKFDSVRFVWGDYVTHMPDGDTVVYCDPPYLGRKPLTQLPPIDADKFWHTMNCWADVGARVFVSEMSAPDGWRPVLTQTRKTCLGLHNPKITQPDHLFVREDQR